MLRRTWMKTAFACAIFLIAALGSIALGSSILSDDADRRGVDVSDSSGSDSSHGSYPVNENGMTYGSDFGKAESPDLILATGDDGKQGYLKQSDIYGPEPKSPEEAAALTAVADQPRVLPLYASDGVTVIGTFTTSPTYGRDE